MKYIIFILVIIPLSLSAWTINLSWDKVLDAHTTSATGIYNILGDSVPELLIPGNKHLYCFSASGESLWTFTPYANYFPAVSSPVAADIDNDGAIEIVVNSVNSVYSLDSSGTAEWEFLLPSPGSVQNCLSSAGLGDVNNDGKLEVLVCATFNNTLYCLDPDSGKEIWHFTPEPVSYFIVGTPTVVDLDLDGNYEILLGTADNYGGRFFCLNETGGVDWDYETPGSGISGWQLTSACVGDVNGDDTLEVISTSNYWGVFCLDHLGNELWKNNISAHSSSYPAMADLDNDGALEVIVALGSNLMVFDAATGDTKWYFSVDAGYYIVSSPGVGELNGDGFLEIIFAELKQGAPNDSTRKMWVLDHNGIDIWSDTVGTAFSDPTIGDIDHDGYMDFLIGPTYQGFRFWDFETDTLTETGHIEWQTIQHDIYRTGLYNFEDTLIGISERAVEHIKSSLTLFPNPACAYVNFHINTMDDNNSILVFDISGRMVTKVKAGIDGKCRLKVSDLPMGVYFAALHANIKEKKKFIVIR